MTRERKLQIGFIAGVVLVLLGTLDPLEGSILVGLGSVVLAVVTRLFRDPHARYYRMAAILILVGVAALWALSALGGFGGESSLGYGWSLLIAPYPVGWLMLLVLFYLRLFVKGK
ncbi:hypothetical protein [Robiginitalea sediminis]|uniref:hypothetical protein n=1 Tax=Robiginitalea sediminis TaxID=1982593 RepID=UPI000B4AB596|nr:hypothetical protein [Robiginitalea sediminis]